MQNWVATGVAFEINDFNGYQLHKVIQVELPHYNILFLNSHDMKVSKLFRQQKSAKDILGMVNFSYKSPIGLWCKTYSKN